MSRWTTLALVASLLPTGPVAKACGACGCTLNSDWASQGYAVRPGARFDLRYDYFNQDQLRSGTRAVARGSFEVPNDQELQEKTINRNLTLTLDYCPDADWGVAVVVPAYNRYHATIVASDTDPSFSQGNGLGDARILGRYQGFSDEHSFGLQFGVKLPTGNTNQTFNAGVETGQLLDAGLQLGTGTTDLLLGFYAFGSLAPDWGSFGQVLFQKPLAERHGFKPGDGVNASLGLRYTGFSGFTPQLQLNLRAEGRESGAKADAPNSGATLVYLSPGFTFRFSPAFDIYLFGQVPVAQRVNGLQLEPRFSVSLGLHFTF